MFASPQSFCLCLHIEECQRDTVTPLVGLCVLPPMCVRTHEGTSNLHKEPFKMAVSVQ